MSTALPLPLVIEDAVIQGRVRRPGDLARYLIALSAIATTVLLAYIAQSTTSGIDQDIAQGAGRLPSALLLTAGAISALGAIALPVLVTLSLLTHSRSRQIIESFAALLATVLLLAAAAWAITRFGSDRLLSAFVGPHPRATAVPFNSVLGALAAFATVSRVMSSSRWRALGYVVLGSIALADVISGGITAAGLGVSVLVGWSVGLITRYLLGTETNRPSGYEIAQTLADAGVSLSLLQANETTDVGRRYSATTTDGTLLNLVVHDRDLDGAQLVASYYRSLRLRAGQGRLSTSMRGRVERIALLSWAAQSARINTPRLLFANDVNEHATVLTYEHIPGRTFDQLQPLGDAELAGAWEIVEEFLKADIALGSITSSNFLLGDDGKVYIQGLDDGGIAASEVTRRTHLAEALCTLALLSDPARAIAAGRVVVGDDQLAKALPALQPFALSFPTRRAVRESKNLLKELRELLIDRLPTVELQRVDIERLKPRTFVTFFAGTVAAYLLFNQLAQVNLAKLFTTSDFRWLVVGLALSALTYLAATAVMVGVVQQPLNLWRTFQAQWAASFATLVAPPTLGSVAVNTRYLVRQGISRPMALASVAMAQALSFVSHVGLLLVFVFIAGTSSDFAFRPPRNALIAVALVALSCAIAFTFPAVRKRATAHFVPVVQDVLPRLTSMFSQPKKTITALGGVVVLNAAYCLCLVASVRAFSDESSIAAISLVYLTASVVGQAAPTPGGLGAVETAVAAGLTAAGIDGGVAVSATLVFRLWTFWVPTIPGWLAFNHLQNTEEI